MRFVWDFIVGPILVLLPKRWRERLVAVREVDWLHAATVSGIYELIAAVFAFQYWYLYEMRRLVDAAVAQALSGTVHVTEHEISAAALFIFFSHPLTWVIFYFFFEGAARGCSGAFTEKAVGTLPLCLTERVLYWTRHRKEVGAGVSEHAHSFADAIHEKVRRGRAQQLADEVVFEKDGEDDMVEIRASQRKEDWDPPKVVRMGGEFYRLEQSWTEKGERPFGYRLRKLAAGVMGRRVLVYEPPE